MAILASQIQPEEPPKNPYESIRALAQTLVSLRDVLVNEKPTVDYKDFKKLCDACGNSISAMAIFANRFEHARTFINRFCTTEFESVEEIRGMQQAAAHFFRTFGSDIPVPNVGKESPGQPNGSSGANKAGD